MWGKAGDAAVFTQYTSPKAPSWKPWVETMVFLNSDVL